MGKAVAKESNKARQAFEDYYALGPGRSLTVLVARYQKRTKPIPPTKHLGQLKKWSTAFKWQARVAERDAEIAQAALAGMKRAATETGFAIYQNRIEALNSLAEMLLGELNENDKRWLPDVKQIGQGEFAERVDIVRFNASLIEQFRKTLEDIAAEMGERTRNIRVDTSGEVIKRMKELGLTEHDVATLDPELAKYLASIGAIRLPEMATGASSGAGESNGAPGRSK